MQTDPIAWLYDLQHFGVKLGLDNIRALLRVLGEPQRSYPSILVAGTNGKGSVAAMLEAMLRAHGLRAGLFSSPHLVRPNERIRIDGEDIATAELQRILRELRGRIDAASASGALAAHPSFFEVVTAAALTAFREAAIECAVLEVGLGGRLDATNAVDPVTSVVVTVDYDHTETLGPTLGRIAAEKAAIARPGRPLVSGVVQDEAVEVLRRVASEVGARLVEARAVAELEPSEDGSFGLRTSAGSYPELRSRLGGAHQWDNARVAVVALECAGRELGLAPDAARVREGLGCTRWPGRLQWIAGHPPLLLDGAHNPAGARALASSLVDEAAGRRAVLLFASMRRKPFAQVAGPLAEFADAVVVTRPSVERAAEPEEVASSLAPLFPRLEVVADTRAALARARALAAPSGFVLVAGSLYLVGEVLGSLENAPVPGPVSM